MQVDTRCEVDSMLGLGVKRKHGQVHAGHVDSGVPLELAFFSDTQAVPDRAIVAVLCVHTVALLSVEMVPLEQASMEISQLLAHCKASAESMMSRRIRDVSSTVASSRVAPCAGGARSQHLAADGSWDSRMAAAAACAATGGDGDGEMALPDYVWVQPSEAATPAAAAAFGRLLASLRDWRLSTNNCGSNEIAAAAELKPARRCAAFGSSLVSGAGGVAGGAAAAAVTGTRAWFSRVGAHLRELQSTWNNTAYGCLRLVPATPALTPPAFGFGGRAPQALPRHAPAVDWSQVSRLATSGFGVGASMRVPAPTDTLAAAAAASPAASRPPHVPSLAAAMAAAAAAASSAPDCGNLKRACNGAFDTGGAAVSSATALRSGSAKRALDAAVLPLPDAASTPLEAFTRALLLPPEDRVSLQGRYVLTSNSTTSDQLQPSMLAAFAPTAPAAAASVRWPAQLLQQQRVLASAVPQSPWPVSKPQHQTAQFGVGSAFSVVPPSPLQRPAAETPASTVFAGSGSGANAWASVFSAAAAVRPFALSGAAAAAASSSAAVSALASRWPSAASLLPAISPFGAAAAPCSASAAPSPAAVGAPPAAVDLRGTAAFSVFGAFVHASPHQLLQQQQQQANSCSPLSVMPCAPSAAGLFSQPQPQVPPAPAVHASVWPPQPQHCSGGGMSMDDSDL